MVTLINRLHAAANGSRDWRARLFREAAAAIEARQGRDGNRLGAKHESAVHEVEPPK
jgi:hypothetical protein